MGLQHPCKRQASWGIQGLPLISGDAHIDSCAYRFPSFSLALGEGFDVQMHTNQLAHVLLLSKLMPQLEACANQTLAALTEHAGSNPWGQYTLTLGLSDTLYSERSYNLAKKGFSMNLDYGIRTINPQIGAIYPFYS